MSINIEQFQQNLIYRTTASVRSLRKEIARIAEFDRFHEAEQSRGERVETVGCVFVLSAVIGGFIGYFVAQVFPSIITFWITFFISLGILGLGTAIWGNLRKKRHSPFNLSSRRYRYELLHKLLEIWQKDLKPSRKLSVSLNLQKRSHKSKFEKQAPYSDRKNGRIDFYRDEWLKVKGHFLDKTKFFLQVTELYQVRSWTNVNGKSRIRPVQKKFEITLSLNYLPSRYSGLSNFSSQVKSAVKLQKMAELKTLEITDDKLKIKVKVRLLNQKVSPNDLDSNQFPEGLMFQSIILMFLSAYQILNLARVMNQQQGA